MTDHKEISKNSYDFAIVGSHFSALLVAYILSRTFHKKVAIIEPQDFVGGEDATIKIDNKKLLSHFSKVSASEQNLDLLHWLATNIEIDIPSDAFEFTPLTIESGKLIPFVGFGERKFSTIELFKDFSSSKNYELSSNLDAWTEHLESCFIGDIYTMAEVTSIEVENGQIKYVAINGSRNLICENLVYCLPPKSIKKLLPIDVVSHKSFQRLLKNKSYSQVRLHLLHDQDVIVEKNPFHILYGGKDDFEPIVGQFSEINSHLCSLWTCWMLTDLIDDHEHLGALLKNIKKQIKRAYPDLFDHVEFEKIIVDVDCEGSVSSDVLSKSFANIEGLWLCHSQLVENTGVIGKILAAKQTLEALQKQLNLKHEEVIIADNNPAPPP